MFPSPLAYKYARAFLNVMHGSITKSTIDSIEHIIAELKKHKNIVSSLKIFSCGEPTTTDALALFLHYFKIESPLKKLAELLNHHKRLYLIREVLQAVKDLYQKDNGIVSCLVTSACEPNNDQKKIIEKFISRYTGDRTQMRYQIDRKLIAGIRIKTDSILWEDSIAKRIRTARTLATRKYHGHY